MPIGIMSALQDEIQVLLDRMTDVAPTPALGRAFYAGELEGQKIVVVGVRRRESQSLSLRAVPHR